MKAWVVTITSFGALKAPDTIDEVVIALISARRKIAFVRAYVEALTSILRATLDEQKTLASYNKSSAKHIARNDGGCCISCFDHPYHVRAQRSDVVGIRHINGLPWLTWQGIEYRRFQEDPLTHQIKKVEDVKPPQKEKPQAKFDLSNHGMFARGTYIPDIA